MNVTGEGGLKKDTEKFVARWNKKLKKPLDTNLKKVLAKLARLQKLKKT